jgi:hypothetical protein
LTSLKFHSGTSAAAVAAEVLLAIHAHLKAIVHVVITQRDTAVVVAAVVLIAAQLRARRIPVTRLCAFEHAAASKQSAE